MMSLRLEPILHCPQLKGKYRSSNCNWTKELDNSALRRKHLVNVESKDKTSPLGESFSNCCDLQVTWALWTDLVKHRWCTWSRHSRGSHHNSTAGLTPLQQNKGVLQASTTTSHTFSMQDLVVWSQPVYFLSFTFTQQASALRQGIEPQHNFPTETINQKLNNVNETKRIHLAKPISEQCFHFFSWRVRDR